jgi:hypothetical protein
MRRGGERVLQDPNEWTVAYLDNHANSLVTERRHQATLSPSLRSIRRGVVWLWSSQSFQDCWQIAVCDGRMIGAHRTSLVPAQSRSRS